MTAVTIAVSHTGYGITGGVNPETVAGFDFTREMLDWAESHGLDIDDPDVHVEVSADAETSEDVARAIAWIEWDVADEQAAAVRGAYDEYEAVRAEASL
jgi:hypothetical protein